MKTTVKRSLLKTLSYGIMSTIATVLIVLMFTKSFVLAGSIGIADRVIKILLYFFHERAWNKVNFGRED
jgi:uncharacterized membrane protein